MTKRRWLPKGVTEYSDRHGKKRYRYRVTGSPPYHFRNSPGTPEFAAELAQAQSAKITVRGARAVIAGSYDDLCQRLFGSPRWLATAVRSQRVNRAILGRFGNLKTTKGERYGDLPAALLTFGVVERELGKMADRPGAANEMRKQLKRLMSYAIDLGWRTDNPVTRTARFATGPGFHSWTDDEIEQYRARHSYGTMARLAMELALNTSGRRCNVAELTRAHLIRGKFHVAHSKGCEAAIIKPSAEALAAIEAMPVTGIGHFIVTEFGRPFSVAGFGNKFRFWCDQAELPHCSIHGLRKAQSRRLAEAGATMLEARAVTGHKRDDTFAYYAERADRERLADAALANLEAPVLANPQKGQ